MDFRVSGLLLKEALLYSEWHDYWIVLCFRTPVWSLGYEILFDSVLCAKRAQVHVRAKILLYKFPDMRIACVVLLIMFKLP